MLMPDLAQAARPTPVRHTAADEFAGFAGSGYLGWTQNSLRYPRQYNLFLRGPGGVTVRVNRLGGDGFGGGIDGTTVVYEEVVGDRSRLVLYDAVGGGYTELPIVDRNGSGSHPTISGAWILYTTGARHRTTRVRLFDRVTGETRQLARIAARGRERYVYSGQVAGDWAAWGRVLPGRQDVFLTNIFTNRTVRIPRPQGVKFQYDPAVTMSGTIFFTRSRPCTRRCAKLNTPAMRAQLVEQRLGGHPRVLAALKRGQDGGYMYAEEKTATIKVFYGLFRRLPHNFVSYNDIFAITVPGPSARGA